MNTDDPQRPDALPRRESPPPDNASLAARPSAIRGDADAEGSSGKASRGPRIVTLGVYGFDETGFFDALRRAGVDTFCDLRFRRGVRGSEYAFVNRRRLEARLAAMGIRYRHFRELAPGRALRERQKAADKAERTAKRARTELSESFVSGYREQCLAGFDSRRFLDRLGDGAGVVALFCVEQAPAACHRSLVAERLQRDLGLEILHLQPA